MVWYEIILQRRWNFETFYFQIPAWTCDCCLQHHLYPALQLPGAQTGSQLSYRTYSIWWLDSILWVLYRSLYAVVSIHDSGCDLFYIFNKNKHEYYQLAFNLMMGMTVFLIVSYVYPNAQHIRPTEFPRDNIFTDIVKWLYSTDTPTNILPSIHVFNSLAIHMSLTNCETLRNKNL